MDSPLNPRDYSEALPEKVSKYMILCLQDLITLHKSIEVMNTKDCSLGGVVET